MKKYTLLLMLFTLLLVSCGKSEQQELEYSIPREAEAVATAVKTIEDQTVTKVEDTSQSLVTGRSFSEQLLQTKDGNYYKATIIDLEIEIPYDSLIGPGTVKYNKVYTEAHDPGIMIDSVKTDNGDFFDIDQKEIEEYFKKKSKIVR